METIQNRTRPTYYFAWPDHEILEDHFLLLSCDEDTWLYKVDGSKKKHTNFELGSPFQVEDVSTVGGTVDSRTFTRRKHNTLRPSLESIIEMSPNNRSSLGLLNTSLLLNDTLQIMPTVHDQEKNSSNFIGSEEKPTKSRVFKLDSPFTNLSAIGGSRCSINNYSFEKNGLNSDISSDLSVPYSLENCSFMEKDGQMTDSLVNFLEKQDYKHNTQRSTDPQVQISITGFPVDIPDSCESHKRDSDNMSNPLFNILDQVNCKPPSGFRDVEMSESVVNVEDVDDFPNCELTTSIKDYLKNVKSTTPCSIKSVTPSETENTPPVNGVADDKHQHLTAVRTAIDGEKVLENSKMNSTYNLEISDSSSDMNSTYDLYKNKNTTYELNNENKEINNVTLTNTVNIIRTLNDKSSCNDELNQTKILNTTYETNISQVQEKSEKCRQISALNNRDLNLNEKIKTSKQIPSRDSSLNTTFTKLPLQGSGKTLNFARLSSNDHARSTEMLNGGLEDDTTSSASDSSFSSCSTKPRSVDELRTIAQQQESSLAQQTSTPVESTPLKMSTSMKLNMDINLSPITKQSIEACRDEIRSTNSSPILGHQQSRYQHPISRLTQPTIEVSHRLQPASSMSNIARPRASGLRMPRPVSRMTAPQKVEPRQSLVPTSAITKASQGIPRPQLSRLPMPRFRGSSIPGPKRGHF